MEGRQPVHGEILPPRQAAARNFAADHEHVVLADAFLAAALARIAVLLLIAAVKLDQRSIGSGKPGAITQQIIARFRELTQTTGTPCYP